MLTSFLLSLIIINIHANINNNGGAVMKHIIKSGTISTSKLSVVYKANPEVKEKKLSENGCYLHSHLTAKPSKLYDRCLSGRLAEIPEGYL